MENQNEFLGGDRPTRPAEVSVRYGSDALAEMLHRLGIEYVALNPGASFRGLHDSIVNHLGNRTPQILLTLHEEHAVSIAQGYAKVKERPMGAIVHSNVGLMHATMSIFNAWCDRAPVIVLGATGPVDAARRRPWIDWIHTAKDQGALVRNYTKWDDQPGSIPAALESLLRANAISRTAPRGPVYVCFDVSLQEDKLEKEVKIGDPARYAPAGTEEISSRAVEKAADLLREAKRPLILMGRTSRSAAAWDRRVKLAEVLGAKVMTDMKTAAAFPSRHPLHAGMPGLFLSEQSGELIRESDVILSLDWIDLAGTLKTAFGREKASAKVIHCSVDQHCHRGWSMDYFGLPPVELPMLAESDALVPSLLEALGELKGSDEPAPEEGVLSTEHQAGPERNSGPISLRDLALCFNKALGERSACITRVPIRWPGDVLDFRDPLDYLGKEGGGGVGAGPGVAVGAALALRGSSRLPIAVLGDGDCVMGITAFWTAARYRIPLLVIVANNRTFGNSEKHQQTVAGFRGRPEENRWIGTRIEDPAVDIAAMARAQGLEAEGPIEDLAQLPSALERTVDAVEKGSACLLDVRVQ